MRAVGDVERGRTRVPHPGAVHRLAEALRLSGEEHARFCAAASRRLGGSTTVVPQQLPRQLPGPVAQFTGRHGELAALTSWLRPDDGEPAHRLPNPMPAVAWSCRGKLA